MAAQDTPSEVKQAMKDNPECAFSTTSRSSYSSVNGDVSRKTVQSWIMMCPHQAAVKVYEQENTETGAAANVGAGGGVPDDPFASFPGFGGRSHGDGVFPGFGDLGSLVRELQQRQHGSHVHGGAGAQLPPAPHRQGRIGHRPGYPAGVPPGPAVEERYRGLEGQSARV